MTTTDPAAGAAMIREFLEPWHQAVAKPVVAQEEVLHRFFDVEQLDVPEPVQPLAADVTPSRFDQHIEVAAEVGKGRVQSRRLDQGRAYAVGLEIGSDPFVLGAKSRQFRPVFFGPGSQRGVGQRRTELPFQIQKRYLVVDQKADYGPVPGVVQLR